MCGPLRHHEMSAVLPATTSVLNAAVHLVTGTLVRPRLVTLAA